MPAPAIKSPVSKEEADDLRAQGLTVPYFPEHLTDRSEGWGLLGSIFGYPEYRDDGIWSSIVVRNNEFDPYPPETSDDRGPWSHTILSEE
jgi:hypothetical protein